jgi:hypothetical protein
LVVKIYHDVAKVEDAVALRRSRAKLSRESAGPQTLDNDKDAVSSAFPKGNNRTTFFTGSGSLSSEIDETVIISQKCSTS